MITIGARWRGRRARRPVPRQGDFFEPVHAEDLYLLSFPRSGNTYLRHLLAALVAGRAPTAAEVDRLVPDVHRARPPVRPSAGPLVAKSHGPATDVPAKVVYMVRDGRAALVSYFAYLQARGRPTPATPAGMLGWADVWPCPWDQHVGGWLDVLAGRDRSMVLRYEDLAADPADALARVAPMAGLRPSAAALAAAVACSTRPAMEAAERAGGAGSLNFVSSSARDWRDVFGPAELCAFERRCGPLLARLGYPLACPSPRTPPSPARRATGTA